MRDKFVESGGVVLSKVDEVIETDDAHGTKVASRIVTLEADFIPRLGDARFQRFRGKSEMPEFGELEFVLGIERRVGPRKLGSQEEGVELSEKTLENIVGGAAEGEKFGEEMKGGEFADEIGPSSGVLGDRMSADEGVDETNGGALNAKLFGIEDAHTDQIGRA